MAASGQDGAFQQVLNLDNTRHTTCPNSSLDDNHLPRTDGLLVDSIGCDFPVENNAFVNIFTSQDVSTDYSDSNNGGLDQNTPQNTDCCLVSSQLSTSNDEILQQTDIETLDASLQNLPKDMYVGKLLEICLNNENMICWYRNVLCSRARLQTDCPKGNLINRKTTKSGSSAQKYARDCHTLYLFTQGDGSNIEQVFDKQKLNSTDMSKVSVVEVRTVVQSLLQRVTDLETLITSKDKTIEAMSSDVLSLQSKHDQLQADYDKLKAEATARFSKYDSIHKLNGDRVKRIESDIENIHQQNDKVIGDVKNLLNKMHAHVNANKRTRKDQTITRTRMNTSSDTPQQNAKMDTGPRSPSNTISDDIAKNLSLIRKETNTKNDTESIFIESSMSPSRAPRGKNQV